MTTENKKVLNNYFVLVWNSSSMHSIKKTEELGLMAEEKISKLSKAKEEKYILRESVQ